MRAANVSWLCFVAACSGSPFATGSAAPDGGPDGTSQPPPISGEASVDAGVPQADSSADGALDATLDSAFDTTPDTTLDTNANGPETAVDATLDTEVPMDVAVDTMDPVDARCPPIAFVPGGIFVAPGGGSSGCGAQSSPCGTIQVGIDQAASGSKVVYVAPGSYPETLTLAAGITISGGWSASWARTCDPTAVQIATTSSDRIASANNLGSPVTLSMLTLANNTAASPGQSLYGIFVVGSFVTLTDVFVSVAAGGAGTTGTPGTAGAAAPATCAAGNGSSGIMATPGAAGTNGTYSMTGFALGSPGTSGGNGTAGAGGMAGGIATCDTTNCETPCDKEGVSPPICTSFPSGTPCCSGAGTNGCGGNLGTGGGGGSGGASSIALFAAASAQVTVTGGTFTSGNGGAGGTGSAGGQGSAGTSGAAGAQFLEHTGCAANATPPSCNSNTHTISGGVAGGSGGTGTGGGTGGGGAGGDSYAYYADSTSQVTPSADTMLIPGSAGLGGTGAQVGPDGNVGDHN